MAVDKVQYYHEISITIPSVDVDAVTNYIIENICGGLLLEDEDEDSLTTVKFYAADKIDVELHLTGLRKYLIAINPVHASIDIHKKRMKELDWIEAYKESVVPAMIGDSIVVKPPWSEESFPGRIEILIEPKMAFGTGRHDSTRGSLAELEHMDLSGRTVLDLGCGSGILGIYAAKQGASEVIGYDIDPLAMENSVDNFELNHVSTICMAKMGTIEDIPDGRQFNIAVVNIIKSVIVPIIGHLKEHLLPDGIMILAGLLDQDREEVEAALVANDLNSFSVRRDNEWVTYTVGKT